MYIDVHIGCYTYIYVYIVYTHAKFCLYMNRCIYIYVYMSIWQGIKNIGLVKGPGGLCATRLATEWGGLATNPPCDKPIEDYSTLRRGPRQGFVGEGHRQRFVAEGGGGDRDKPLFRVTAIYMYI